tara:strand:- start:1155 stop:2285 length:1131 start_codon:yes stop_codon:yes gene_type:complete
MASLSTDPFASLSECYIDTPADLGAFVESVVSSGNLQSCAIDMEADSMHSYETKLCLIQFAVPGHMAIIDPLAFTDDCRTVFTEFIDRFETVWMHGADYDISLFKMTFNWAPKQILDTQIGARFLGAQKFGLAHLLEEEYGVKLSKQSQKADWSRRPLSDTMLAYAFNDVRYLIDMGEKIEGRLVAKGRKEWFLESCDSALQSAFGRDGRPPKEHWRISGWGKLSAQGLNFLKYLWLWRDEECSRLDRPAFKFLGNQELLRMAGNLEVGKEVEPPHYLRPNYVKRLNEWIEKAKQVVAADYPSKRVRGNGPRLDIDDGHFGRIRARRDSVAEELGLEPALIANRNSMEMLASSNLSEEQKGEVLLSWQRKLVSEAL